METQERPYGTELSGIGGKAHSVTLDAEFNADPYLEDALKRLKSSDREGDRTFILDSLTERLKEWNTEGDALAAARNQACFLLWAIENGLSEKKLSPMVNDLPGVVLTDVFHDLFRKHMDEGKDLSDSVRFHWHHTLFVLYQTAYEESREPGKGFLMLTQAFAMSEIYVNNGMWKEARSGLEDTISFGEDLEVGPELMNDHAMLMGISSFYLGWVMEKSENNPEAMKELYREALDRLEPIPEDFNQGIPEVIRICREALA